MGKISRVENPLFVRPALWIWQRFAQLQLHEAQHTEFKSIRDCFTRALKPTARVIDSSFPITSPCDGILGACGTVQQGQLHQIKGFPYTLAELVLDPLLARQLEGATYVTIRITASMYHRLHAPCSLTVNELHAVHGDAWNVTPATLKRVEKLFCKNERAVLGCTTEHGELIHIIPIAAVLVAGIRLHCAGLLFDQTYRGPLQFELNQPYQQGQELGWFEHGSTVVMVLPAHYRLAEGLETGSPLRMGQGLLQRIPVA